VASPAAGLTHAQGPRRYLRGPDNNDVFRELVVTVCATEVKMLTLKR
jgi:hypothetical protein